MTERRGSRLLVGGRRPGYRSDEQGASVACNSILVDAHAQGVYDVLADPTSYEIWVVGNKSIRGYDKSWPTPGSEFHHKVGFGLLATKDKTKALEAEPPRRLVMVVRALPFIRATVSFTLTPEGSGTRVTMDEHPRGGPWEKVWNPALDLLTGLRNAETLRRLKRLAEVRAGAVHQ
jgi:uncharacterized protein YndB with AHSA1/START domain